MVQEVISQISGLDFLSISGSGGREIGGPQPTWTRLHICPGFPSQLSYRGSHGITQTHTHRHRDNINITDTKRLMDAVGMY